MHRVLFYLLLIIVSSGAAAETLLKVELKGANKEQRQNILAHLGALPTTPELRASYVFSASQAAEKAMQALGYYQSQALIDLEQDRSPWLLKITLLPGPETLISEVDVVIKGEAANLSQFTELASQAGLVEGKRLNHGLYDKVKNRLVNQGLQMGFFDSRLESSQIEVNRDENSARIQLIYDSGPRYTFGEVHFEGTTLSSSLLQKMVTFQPDDPYDANQISNLHSELISSGYFSGIKVLPELDLRESGEIPVLAELTPAPSHKVDLGIGYATDTRARTSVTWRTPQINNYGHSQETRLEYSEVNPYLRFRYQIPWEHPNHDVIQLGLDVESDEYGDLESTYYSAMVARVSKAESWLRQVELRVMEERWNILGQDYTGGFILPSVTYSKTRRRGNPVDPSSGFRQLFQVAIGAKAFGSKTNLIRGTAQFRLVKSLAEKHRLVSRAEFGAAYFEDRDLDKLPPSLRFYAGGDQSMRGFAYQSLGPSLPYIDQSASEQSGDTEPTDGSEPAEPQEETVVYLTTGGRYLAVGSLEYQYYVTPKWRVAAFTDFGNAFDDLDKTLEPAYSIGVGAHWLSPVGAIKIDVGYGVSEEDPPWRLHISMGAEL